MIAITKEEGRLYAQAGNQPRQLRSCHISLYTVLCQAWIGNGCRSPFNISRSKVMKLAKIHSTATYYKVIHELTSHGYILYNPSYHPAKGTEVSLLGDFCRAK